MLRNNQWNKQDVTNLYSELKQKHLPKKYF